MMLRIVVLILYEVGVSVMVAVKRGVENVR